MAQQQIPSLLPLPIAFAHRGAKAHAPENTLDSFSLALRLGANGLETDAWLTSDNVVVLDHDGIVRRRGRKRPIAELNFADLPRHIPSLEQLLQTCASPFDLSIDIKDDGVTPHIVSVAQACSFPLNKLWLCHWRHEEVLAIRQRFNDIRVVDSTRLKRLKMGLEHRANINADAGVDAINLHFSDWSGGMVALVHRFNLYAFGWDVQFDHQLETAMRMGLDALYSDYVDRMVDTYVKQFGTQPMPTM